jgi:integrase
LPFGLLVSLKSLRAGNRTVEAFQRICGKTYIREVIGGDLVAYFKKRRVQANLDPKDPEHTEQLRKRNVTVSNHDARLRTFFKRFKIDVADLLEESQFPRARNRVPEAYPEAEMLKLSAACTAEEKRILQFFCASGLRRGEVAHTYWSDLDLQTGILKVTAKPDCDWKPKDKEPRDVRQPNWLLAKLKARREKRQPYAAVSQRHRNASSQESIVEDAQGRGGACQGWRAGGFAQISLHLCQHVEP